MLTKVKLFRRHNKSCHQIHQPHLKEDTVECCDCNLGYKGVEVESGKFRRLMFIPPIKEVRLAWRMLDDLEQGKQPEAAQEADRSERLLIGEALDKYYELARQRSVKASSIYSMSRVVGNAIERLADSRGFRYIDEVGESFGPDLMSSFNVTVNTLSNYRRWFFDFCRVAKTQRWTSVDLAVRVESPGRGKGRTAPPNPTEPFDLVTELPKIMEAIPKLTFEIPQRRLGPRTRSPWRKNEKTARALLLLLRFTGLRISDALLFEPRSLEKRSVRDSEGNTHEVYVMLVRKQKKTDTPVFVIIPLEVGEFIKDAPRLSEKYAFIPNGRDIGTKFRSWLSNSSGVLFTPLEAASGVSHIHAHRFRDTFAVELYRKTKDMAYVSRALGHSSVVVTMNHYSHFLQEDQDDAIRKMLDGWNSPSGVPGVFPSFEPPNQSLNG